MASKKDCTAIMRIITAANPHVKFNDDTATAWAISFREVPRLKLFLVAKEFIKTGTRFTPSVSEIWAAVEKFTNINTYWQPPADLQDERCMWFMAISGLDDPFELTEKQVNAIYETQVTYHEVAQP